MSEKRPSLVSAALATYATQLAAATLSFLNVLIVARSLGPVGRGEVAFLITVAILTANLATFGIQEANANLAGREPRLRRALATNSIALGLLFGAGAVAIVSALMVGFPGLRGDVAGTLFAFAFLAIPLLILRIYFNLLVQADYRFGVTNAAWLAGPATTFTANGALALTGSLSVTSAILAWVVGQSFGVLILLTNVARRDGLGRPDPALATKALGFGAKTHIGRSMTLGNWRVDQWFVGALAGSRELGLYSVAVAWAEILFYIPAVLVLVQRPDLVRASPADAARLAATVLRIALLLAVSLSLFLIVAAPVLCTRIFGEDFRGSVDDLRVLALGAFGICALELLGSALNAQRKPMLTTASVGFAFAVTIALDLLLIPDHGGLGAAIATASAWTVGAVVVIVLFTRAFPARIFDLVPRGSDLPWVWRSLRARFVR